LKILLLHGWLLERSGSNVYTAALATHLSAQGHEVHVFCQERHPDRLDFVQEAWVYDAKGGRTRVKAAPEGTKVVCTLHRPDIGDLLPVYNLDEYEGFSVVKRFVDIEEEELEAYFAANLVGLESMLDNHEIDIAFANHTFPNPTILQRFKESRKIPFAVFPHGSAIEYAVKKRDMIFKLTEAALDSCDRLIVGNDVVSERIWRLFPDSQASWKRKHAIVSVGVDISLFEPVATADRGKSIDALIAEGNPGDGKSQKHVAQLLDQARSVDSDEALLRLVRDARGQYKYTSPDADLPEKLGRVNWDKDKVIVYVGKLIAGKGVHDLLLALPAILKECPTTQIVLVGESTYRETLEILLMALDEGRADLVDRIIRMGWALDERAEKELDKARQYVDKVGMDTLMSWGKETKPSKHVIFAGYLNHPRFKNVLPCGDVAVFPSEIAEAYPLVLLESISAGVLPVVSYFEGLKAGIDAVSAGLPEDLRETLRIHNDSEEGKIQELARKIPALLNLGEDHTAYCRDLAVSTYSWPSVARSLAEELQRAMEASRAAGH
jgi:glycosyltransferase involved in cell wall biosynthesis